MLAVVFFPKVNLENINRLREKYDMNQKIIQPHITIVSPISELSENQLVEYVEKITKSTEAFSIRLTGLTITPDGCLFLMVKDGKDKIGALHDQLYSGILAPFLPTTYEFAPHITLADFTEPNKKLLTQACAEAQDLNIDITCNFDTLAVIKGDGISPATIVKIINLNPSRI